MICSLVVFGSIAIMLIFVCFVSQSRSSTGLVNNAQFGNIDPVSGLTLSEQVYLDPLEKAYQQNKRRLT